MTAYEAIALGLASIAVLMSGYALWIMVPLRERQRGELEEARARRQQADVRVKLVSCFGRRDRVVVENRGEGTARAVHLKIKPSAGSEDPVAQSEYARKLPIEVLRSGERVEIAASTVNPGDAFDAKWWWQDENGKQQEREQRLTRHRLER